MKSICYNRQACRGAKRGSSVSVAFDGIKVRSATTPTQSVIGAKKLEQTSKLRATQHHLEHGE